MGKEPWNLYRIPENPILDQETVDRIMKIPGHIFILGFLKVRWQGGWVCVAVFDKIKDRLSWSIFNPWAVVWPT